jgi:hypothetical protein
MKLKLQPLKNLWEMSRAIILYKSSNLDKTARGTLHNYRP